MLRLTTLLRAVGNDKGFEVKVIDVKAQMGDGESKEAKGKDACGKEELGEVQCDGGRQENSLRTVRSNSQVLYTNTGWSVCIFRVGLHRVHGWAPFLFGAPLVGDAPSVGAVGAEPQLF